MRPNTKKATSWLVFGFLLFCISFSVLSMSSKNDSVLDIGYASMDVQECGCSKCHTVELEGCHGCHNARRAELQPTVVAGNGYGAFRIFDDTGGVKWQTTSTSCSNRLPLAR